MVKSTFLDRSRNHMEQKLFFRLVEERLTALPPPTSLFWSPALCWPSVFWAVGWHESQVSPTALFILSCCLLYAPCRARHNATLRKYLNLVLFFSCSASEKGEKKKKKRSKRYLPICSEQKDAQQLLWSASSLWSHRTPREQTSPSRRHRKETIQREFM